MSSSREKLALLRVRALALRERAVVLAGAFTEPALRECVARLLLGIDEEIDWLDRRGKAASLPRLQAFLPGTTATVAVLESALRRMGRHAAMKALSAMPEFARALEDACAEPAARRARPPSKRSPARRRTKAAARAPRRGPA